MSIVVVMEWDEVVPTQDQYWAVTEKFGLQEKLPDGCEYHVVGIDPEIGARTCEVCDSEQAHGRYLEEVGPSFQEIGIPPPSKVMVMPLLRHLGTK